MVAEKIETALAAANKSLVRMLVESQPGEHLIEHAYALR